MRKRIEPLSISEKKRFMSQYLEIRETIQNKGIRRFVMVMISTAVYLMLHNRFVFLETALKFIVLLFLVSMLKSFGHIIILDRIYAWYKKYGIQ